MEKRAVKIINNKHLINKVADFMQINHFTYKYEAEKKYNYLIETPTGATIFFGIRYLVINDF